MLKAGIIGLPNVGKSSLFSLLTLNDVVIANYPFATIDPNIGIASVNDSRLKALAKFFNSKKVIPAIVKFWDIAGLVQDASEGAGLGNKFLAHIREANVLIHIVRSFSNKEVTHVHENLNPLWDFQIIYRELSLADLVTINKHLAYLKKMQHAQNSMDSDSFQQIEFISKIKQLLNDQKLIFQLNLSKQEEEWIRPLNLLSYKKMLVVINVDAADSVHLSKNKPLTQFIDYLTKEKINYLTISIEYELALRKMSQSEKESYQEEFCLKGEDHLQLIKKTHQLLNLGTFFTAGPVETKAWSFVKGSNARTCSGLIHTDFAKGFIRCEVIFYNSLLEFNSELDSRNAGKMASVGQDYKVQDGDVCHFLFK